MTQAFPRSGAFSVDHQYADMGDLGMTLRQHYAGLALQALIAKFPARENVPPDDPIYFLAACSAFAYADAMLKAGDPS